MNPKSFLQSFKESKWYSRKLAIVIAGLGLIIAFPEASVGITTIIGLFCGANVAQKFTPLVKEIAEAASAAKDLADEATKSPNNEKND